jgi:hypothetical protein
MCLLSNTRHNKAEVIIKLALNTNQLIILSNFFDISDFSLDSWISKNNLPQNLDPLPQWAVERLMQKWGVSQFITDQSCTDIYTEFKIDTSSGKEIFDFCT